MRQWKGDTLLIVGVLVLVVVLWLFLQPNSEGTYAVITHHGTEVARYPLAEDRSVTIGTDAFNTITISDGMVFVSDANCGDHTCIKTGRISRQGEQIICLPHAFIIEVVGGDQSELDASTH